MNITRRLLMIGAALGLAGCATKFKSYAGPEITRVQVFKEARMMRLLSGSTVIRTYNFELGFAPTEHKQIEGDGRTPEGAYLINRRNQIAVITCLWVFHIPTQTMWLMRGPLKITWWRDFHPRNTDQFPWSR